MRKQLIQGKASQCGCHLAWASLVAQTVKNLPVMWETQVQSLGWEDPLEKGMATHSSILAWRILWTEEPVWLLSTGLQRVIHDLVTDTFTLFHFLRWKDFPGDASGKEPTCHCRRHKRHGFNPYVGKNPLKEGMVTHSNILAWRVPWTEEPGELWSIGLQRVGHDWKKLYMHTH